MVLTIEECADELKVTPEEILHLIENGEMKAKKIGEQYRIAHTALHQYLSIGASYDFQTWSMEWLKIYKKPYVTTNTYEGTYRLYVEKHLIPFFGHMKMQEIMPADVQRFYASKKSLSKSALNKMNICLKGIFKTAIENDVCIKNPTLYVTLKSDKAKTEKKVYDAQQEELIKKIAIGEMPGIVLCLETGIRPGEFTGLRWKDIRNKVLYVNRSIAYSKTEQYIIRPPKWDSYRMIPLSPTALIALQRMKNEDCYVFPMTKNTPYTPRAWDKKVQRFFDSVLKDHPDIPRLTPHEFRHTFGTKLRRQGVDIYTIQKLLGHKSIKVTTETYVHNEIEVLKKAMGL